MTYSEKLRDPKWQKMRLEVMERDDFTCVQCGDSASTLNVHHCYYKYGRDPWEYEVDSLITLCETCHKYESEFVKSKPDRMSLDTFFKTKGFTSMDIEKLINDSKDFERGYINEVCVSIVSHLLTSSYAQDVVLNLFLNKNKKEVAING